MIIHGAFYRRCVEEPQHLSRRRVQLVEISVLAALDYRLLGLPSDCDVGEHDVP